MTQANHLFVSAGPDRGKQINVTPEGIRIGRSSKNDVVLVDPRLSRHHCRLFFRPDGNLCVADLGSVNKTYVNDIEVQEAVLNAGDIISLGETKISFVGEGIVDKPAGVIDLGL